jgi:hypothetical protein
MRLMSDSKAAGLRTALVAHQQHMDRLHSLALCLHHVAVKEEG